MPREKPVAEGLETGGLAMPCISGAAASPWIWDLSLDKSPVRFLARTIAPHQYAGSLVACHCRF